MYKWRAQYAGLEVSDVKKLRQLEDENRRLKQMVAEQALDIQALKAITAKIGGAQGEASRSPVGGASKRGLTALMVPLVLWGRSDPKRWSAAGLTPRDLLRGQFRCLEEVESMRYSIQDLEYVLGCKARPRSRRSRERFSVPNSAQICDGT